jgi:ER lumen protein retaining receptor
MMADNVSWNIYRYAADYLHFGGMILGLVTIWSSKSVQCFSRKTQILYQTVYVTRYLDVFTESQVMYLMFFKITFNLITAAMLTGFSFFHHTYDVSADSCNLVAILAPTLVAAIVLATGAGLQEQLWTWSEFIEPFALVPQYIMCYRSKNIRPVTLLYVLAVGGYRLLYVCNWMYKRFKWHSAYHDYTSWIGGGLECVLFIDFVLRIAKRSGEEMGASFLGQALLNMDEKANSISEQVEMKALGRRLPYGLSGPAHKLDSHDSWEASDQLMDEEGCKLLTLSGDVDGSL